MARLPILQDDSLDSETLDVLRKYKQQNGIDSTLHRVLANNPKMYALFNGYTLDIKRDFSLGAETEKLIILLIASIRKCE